MAKSSTVWGHSQQSCVVQKWKCDRRALANRHERRSVISDDDLYQLQWERTAPGGTLVRFDGDTCRWSSRAWKLSSLELPNRWRSLRSVGVIRSNLRFHIMSRAADLAAPAAQRLRPSRRTTIYKQGNYYRETVSQYMRRLDLFNTRSTYGQRCIKYKGSSLWNNLPMSLRLCSSFTVFKRTC